MRELSACQTKAPDAEYRQSLPRDKDNVLSFAWCGANGFVSEVFGSVH